MTWVLWIAGALGALGALYLLLYLLTARRSDAGIITSRLGRSLRIVGASVRLVFRQLKRRLQRALTSSARRAELDRRFHEETARGALEAMGNMKGVLMKLGQIVSFMDETLPAAYQQQLRKLQADAPPMDYDAVARVIAEELGDEPPLLFDRFEREPLAAASIGQVHRARKRDGARSWSRFSTRGSTRRSAPTSTTTGC